MKTNSPVCTAGSQEDTPVVSLLNCCGNAPCSWLPLETLHSAAMHKSIHCQGCADYSIRSLRCTNGQWIAHATVNTLEGAELQSHWLHVQMVWELQLRKAFTHSQTYLVKVEYRRGKGRFPPVNHAIHLVNEARRLSWPQKGIHQLKMWNRI